MTRHQALKNLEWIDASCLHKVRKAMKRHKIYLEYPDLMPEMTRKILRTRKKNGMTTGYEGTFVQDMLDCEDIPLYE